MVRKNDFKETGHLKSDRYYLTESPLLTIECRESGLLANLIMMASVYPCAATYKRCYSEVPMVRLRSKRIVDNRALKFQYWGNSFLFMQNGYHVRVIIPTETEIEWLATPSEEEKTIVELAMSNESNENPRYYLNHELYFMGHLDKDNIPLDITNMLSLTPQVSEELANSFSQLGNAKAPTPVGDLKMVVVNPN